MYNRAWCIIYLHQLKGNKKKNLGNLAPSYHGTKKFGNLHQTQVKIKFKKNQVTSDEAAKMVLHYSQMHVFK